MSKKNKEVIKELLKKVFKTSKIPKKIENLNIGDLKKWDSLGHFHLLLEVEKKFNIRFNSSVFTEIKSIKQILKELKKSEK
tara:strand:- start:62 stop:304 length:243 start_codon:yes stop_codon:yes gene_type:complete